jgi:hypothetical protein
VGLTVCVRFQKCQLCSERHGTKIQCTKSEKCVRAFHVTCAIREGSGVVLDAEIDKSKANQTAKDTVMLPPEQPPDAAGRTDPPEPEGEMKLVVLCRQHNPVCYWSNTTRNGF